MIVLRIILLALAAAVFPALLACVAVLISRPNPRRLLTGFYCGALTASMVSGWLVLKAFERGEQVAGSSRHAPSAGLSIAFGVVGLSLSWLLMSRRGRSSLDAVRSRRSKKRPASTRPKGPSWVQRRLDRAGVGAAVLVGAVINLPGPFYVIALGDIAVGGYTEAVQLALALLFNGIMFLLIEVPLVGYLLSPETTGDRVASFAAWLNANGLRVVGALVGLASVGLLVQGLVSAL